MDFAFGVKENTEDVLWVLHTAINSEYRRIQSRLRQSAHAVERRKLEKHYNNFLRVAQKFYRGYIQRLAARYDVPELRRAARGIDVNLQDNEDSISPVPTELSAMVLTSCHSTLLRLGDLSRYRTQARHKNSTYQSALTYYSLAHLLKPQSGYAYHQMGMVHLDQGNHLDVVYNFYRSWAVDAPHPNAKANLEAEFKSLQLPNSSKSRQNTSSAAQDAFSMWFVRLHALFYKGENFPQQAELEGEVKHRLEMACHSDQSADTLGKMALVNISALHIASTLYKGWFCSHPPPGMLAVSSLANSIPESMALAASRFYQFALRFNAMFVSTFCAAFESELKEATSENGTTDGSDTASPKISPMVAALLPILRLYSMWLAAHRSEICAAIEAFGGVVPCMVQNLAKVFTLLCVFTYSQTLATCPYLLKEDLEIRGFRPISGETIPQQCRCFCSEDGSPKIYLQDEDSRLAPSQENLARVLDILRCAYFLAEDSSFPLHHKVVDNSLIFEYGANGTVTTRATDQSTPTMRVVGAERSAAPSNAAAKDTPRKEHIRVRSLTSRPSPGTLSPEEPLQLSSHSGPDVSACKPPTAEQQQGVQDEGNLDDTDNALFDMLSPFLKPPTPQPQQRSGQPTDESSYGMHTTTANNALGSFQTERSPSGPTPSGKFAQLPWAWFNTPEPERPVGGETPNGQTAFSANPSPYHSPTQSMNSGNTLDDPFATPGRNNNGVFANGHAVQPQNRRSVTGPVMSNPESAHRSHLLQAFSGTNVPRSSPFTQWGENQQSTRQNNGPAVSPWGPRALDNLPQSTGTSAFSHPSSLYQGTPANDVGLGLRAMASGGSEHQPLSPAHVEPTARYLQMDQTTLNYNEAILQAAYRGHK